MSSNVKSATNMSLADIGHHLTAFLNEGVWQVQSAHLSRTKAFWLKRLRVVLLAVRGFYQDSCELRASALTFYTLLSIVPLFAMAFGIAKGFGFEAILEKKLFDAFVGQEEVISRVVEFSRSLLDQTRSGLIAGIGVVVLLWTVVKVLSNIENSFNHIWGIQKSRTLGRKFSDYLSTMMVCPVLVIASSSATVYVASHVQRFTDQVVSGGLLHEAILGTLSVLPYCVLWGVFSFLYVFIPNTKVQLRFGIVAGVIAGTLYQLLQWGYIHFQIGVASYGAIYGSFAALPLFLIWLQLSWTIVLLGAEISYAEQNVESYEFEPQARKLTNRDQLVLALGVSSVCAKNFVANIPPPTACELAVLLGIPLRFVNEVTHLLCEGRILSETRLPGSEEVRFQPARPVSELRVKDVMQTLGRLGIENEQIAKSKAFQEVLKPIGALDDLMSEESINKPLADLAPSYNSHS